MRVKTVPKPDRVAKFVKYGEHRAVASPVPVICGLVDDLVRENHGGASQLQLCLGEVKFGFAEMMVFEAFGALCDPDQLNLA